MGYGSSYNDVVIRQSYVLDNTQINSNWYDTARRMGNQITSVLDNKYDPHVH